jgi:HSP20 family protein
MVVRWDPFRDLMDIQGELNRLFARSYAPGDGGTKGELAPLARGTWTPALDMYEKEDALVLTVELPGLEPDQVDVTVEDSVLTISGARSFSEETSEEQYHRIERRYGAFSRSVQLPATADANRIDASFDKGVLTVRVPKSEEAKPKKILVKANG